MLILRNVLFTLVLMSSCVHKETQTNQTQQQPSLLGSWKMTSVHWKSADTTYSIHQAQPGVFMIDEHRYATMWTPIDQPRTPFKDLSAPTKEELVAGFRSVVFNSGTYEMTDSTLTTTALIAKVPGFEGGIQFYRYKIKGDSLALTMFDETYPDGEKPNWFGKYVSIFKYVRVK